MITRNLSVLYYLALFALIFSSCGKRSAELEIINLEKVKGVNELNKSNFLSTVSSLENFQDNLLLADNNLSKLIRLNQEFKFLSSTGSLGNGPNDFNGITQLAVNKAGNIFVFDEGHRRIVQVSLEGEFINSTLVPNSYSGIHRFAVDNDSHMYVTSPEGNAPILVFNGEGKIVKEIGAFYDFDGPQRFVRNFRHLLLTEDQEVISASVTEPIIEVMAADGSLITSLNLADNEYLKDRLNFIKESYQKEKDSRSSYSLFQDAYFDDGYLYLLYLGNTSDNKPDCNKVLKIQYKDKSLVPVSVLKLGQDTNWFSNICVNKNRLYAFENHSAEVQEFSM